MQTAFPDDAVAVQMFVPVTAAVWTTTGAAFVQDQPLPGQLGPT